MSDASENRLEFRLLGEPEIRRGGRPVALPPSKKTRALLSYLVLTGRSHRREQLCELFWDVADDRRGALRWSLSKLRLLVDDEERPRIVADREHVVFEPAGAVVDALELRAALQRTPVERIATEALERLAAAHRGELLEGLDLPDFDDYQAWCVAERERARGLHTTVLGELVRRAADDPARAVEHARTWVRVDPLDEAARAQLVRLLGRVGLRDEARQHYESGRRLEAELGRDGRGELAEAWRAVEEGRAGAPVVATPALPAAEPPLLPGEPADAPLVGRARELEALLGLVADAEQHGALQALVLEGEPGVGKSRLLLSFMHRVQATGAVVLHGASFEAESRNPYSPWIDALGRVPGGALGGAPALALLRGAAGPDERASDPLGRERLYGSVADAVAVLAARGRAVAIVLDDAQWLDEGSAELLHYVARVNRHRAVAVVIAAREGDLEDHAPLQRVLRGLRREGVARELGLGPLDADETAALVRAVRGDADAGRIHAQSAGNPLFALELTRAAGGDDVPATLGGLVRDRLAQLPAEAADILRWGAVLGCGFTVEEIDALTTLDVERVMAALELLERRAVLARDRAAGGSAYVFSHEVVRRVVYADLSEPRRRLMHKRVAEHLSRRAEATPALVGDVAHHAALAQDSALAATACLEAARRSLRLFASGDAAALCRRGLRHAEQLAEPERTRLTLELLEVAWDARRPEDAGAAAARVEGLAERALDLGCLEHARLGFHLLSWLRWESGDWSEARRHMLQAELVSRGASEREQIVGMAEAARCLVLLERDLGQAQALALEAAARGRQAGVEPPATFDALGMLKLHQGRADEAAEELERARGLARASRDRHDEFQALEHLVMLELQRGDHAAALTRAEELAALGAKFREGSEAPFARALVALARRALGDAEAETALERELVALTEADAKHRLAYVLSRAALLDELGGATERACDRAERALSIAALLERPTEVTLARLVLARCADRRGDADEARRHARELSAQELNRVAAPVRELASAVIERHGGV